MTRMSRVKTQVLWGQIAECNQDYTQSMSRDRVQSLTRVRAQSNQDQGSL